MILHEEPCYSGPNDAGGGWAEFVERLGNFSIAAECIFVQELWQDWEGHDHHFCAMECKASPVIACERNQSAGNHDLEISNRGIPGI